MARSGIRGRWRIVLPMLFAGVGAWPVSAASPSPSSGPTAADDIATPVTRALGAMGEPNVDVGREAADLDVEATAVQAKREVAAHRLHPMPGTIGK